MRIVAYRARQGDVIWIDLNPQAGHEQQGRRPALVVSNNTFNDFSKTSAMLCPITGTDRGLPIHIRLDGRTKTGGVIMCDQAKILDLQRRRAEFIEKAPDDIIFEVSDTIISIIEIE